MDDVARACGYSRATVSLALRGSRTIPEETRVHIVAAAQQLGYRTNPLVAALMSMQRKHRPTPEVTNGIAYLTTHPVHDPWRSRTALVSMYDGAAGRAAELGFRLEEFNLREEGMTRNRIQNILHARNIHAAVVAPLPRGETAIDFDFSSLAAVGVGMSVRQPLIERVASDHFQSAALAVSRCVELGYRRIGIVLNHEGSHRLEHRWAGGFLAAAMEHGLETRIPLLMPSRREEIAKELTPWLKRHRPDVIIFDNIETEAWPKIPPTVGAVNLSLDRGDDQTTGIFQNSLQIGRTAVEHAVARLNTNDFGLLRESHVHMVAGTWVPGRTALGPGRVREGSGVSVE